MQTVESSSNQRCHISIGRNVEKQYCAFLTDRTDVLSQDLVKTQDREIHILTFWIALKFDRHLGSTTAEMPVKFESDLIIITPDLAPSRLDEILR